MTRAQFIFSLGSALGLAATGFGLASSGVADWGLFWVGIAIGSVTLAQQNWSANRLIPAPAKLDS